MDEAPLREVRTAPSPTSRRSARSHATGARQASSSAAARRMQAAGSAAAVVAVAAAIPAVTGAFGKGSAGPRRAPVPRARPPGTAYVVNSAGGTVTPIDLATNTPGEPIKVGGE